MPEYKIIQIWEHEWIELKKKDDEIKAFVENLTKTSPLEVRNCLYGGRTNAFKLFHNCSNDEFINYIDVTSLYPYVQKYEKYIIGHPIIITENFDYSINAYFGAIKCKILAPKKLHFPVLPFRYKGKMIIYLNC